MSKIDITKKEKKKITKDFVKLLRSERVANTLVRRFVSSKKTRKAFFKTVKDLQSLNQVK